MLKDGCQWKALAEIKYNDGAVISISNESIMENGLSFYDGTSQKNKFCVGSFVSKMITLKLCNFENKFVEDRFQGAQIHLKLGLFLEDTQLWEWIDLGTFFVDKHPSSGGVITLTAYNNAVNFEKKYDSKLAYPATLSEILQDACANCGVPLYSTTFPNSDYVVTARPSDDATTYADIVSYVAQLSACFAKCNNLGQLVLDWYDLDRFYPESGDTVDGNDALTASGNPVNFDAYPNTLIRRLNVIGHQGKNRFNYNALLEITYDSSTGIPYDNPSAKSTPRISCLQSTDYFLSGFVGGVRIFFWNETTYLSSFVITSGHFITPANATNMAFGVAGSSSFTETTQLELGAAATAYEPFCGVAKVTVNGTDNLAPNELADGDSYDFITGKGINAAKQPITGAPQIIRTSSSTTVSCDNGGNVEVTYSGPDVLDGGPFYPSAPATDGGSFADYADDDAYDGGGFTDYSEADSLDGGNFIDYGATPSDILSGGVFRKNLSPPARIASLTSYETASKDIRITGVQLVPMDKNKPTLKKGVDGYVISIEKNPLAQDNLDALVDFLAYRLIDFSFRPMQATGWDDPSYEAGDVAILTDPSGNQYQTIISNLNYSFGDYESYSADAESESENQHVSFDVGAKAAQTARDETTRQITAYDQAVGTFTSMAALAMGLYSTKQQLDDGSFILYWHDKPNLADSQTIWKLTKNVFVVSDDGGNSWRGMDKDGNILAKVLNVIGINADWINAGTIKVGGLTGKSIVSLSDDGNMRCVQNGTDGFVIQQKVGSDWVTTWQADSTSGKTIAYNLNHTQKVEMGGDVGYRTYLWNDLFGWMLTGGQGADGGTGASKIFNPEAPYDYGMIGATPEGNSGLTLFHNGYEFCRLLDTGGGEGTGFALVLSNESWPFGASTDGSTYMKYGNSGTPSEVACGDGLINFDIGGKVCGAVGTNGVQANTVSGDLPCKGATGYGDFTLHIDHGVITGWDNR